MNEIDLTPVFFWVGLALIAFDYFGPKGAGVVFVVTAIFTIAVDEGFEP